MRKIMFLMALLVSFPVFSQFSDDFSDNNFTGNPPWYGDAEKFEIDQNSRLHLFAENAASTAQLFTPSPVSLNTSWEFEVRVQSSLSTENHVKVYLCADTAGTGKLWGLCLRIGASADKNVALWYEPVSGTGTRLLSGTTNRLTSNPLVLQVKATLSWDRTFHLYTKLEGENDYQLEGESQIDTKYIPNGKYFGVYCKYTAQRSKNIYFFDSFQVTQLQNDVPESANPRDVVINEVLYQPVTNGDEYLELYNRSNKQIDLSLLSIATRKVDGTLQHIKPLSSESGILHPNEYLLVTGTKENVCSFYTCFSDIHYCELTSMISLPDDGATIVLFNNQSDEVIDEFTYTKQLHAAGTGDAKGIALERINPDKDSNLSSNWTSASSISGNGTPGSQNSQYNHSIGNGIEVIEPNRLEGKDFFQILYSLIGTDNRCNLKIFDSAGRLVESVLNNGFIGSNGTLQWNPSGKLQPGIYIILLEVFRPSTGETEKYKLPVILRY
jgi:hypothetical protein